MKMKFKASLRSKASRSNGLANGPQTASAGSESCAPKFGPSSASRVMASLLALQIGIALPVTSHAALQPVVMDTAHLPPSLRWIYGVGEMPKGKSIEAVLARAKKYQIDENWKECIVESKSLRTRAVSLAPWLGVMELECALEMEIAKGGEPALRAAIENVKHHPDWLLRGAHLGDLKSAFIKAQLALLERDSTNNRSRIWEDLESSQDFSNLMDSKTRARMWAFAGEAAFLQQKLEAARDLLHRSLQESDSDDVRSRLRVVENSLTTEAKAKAKTNAAGASKDLSTSSQAAAAKSPSPAPSATPMIPPPAVAVSNSNLEASQTERDLVDRVTVSLKAGDFVSAASDCAKLIREFPGGSRAKWANDRMFETYSNLSDKTDDRYTLLRQEIIAQMQKVDGDRMAEWARLMYNRGQWEDALTLSKQAAELMKGSSNTKILELEGDAALASDQFDTAHDVYDLLIAKYAGTPAARSALFHSGLLHYREKKYPAAAAEFERLLALPQMENLELSSRYWLWRSLQKNNSPRADLVADDMMRKFPFSYYGLRARLDRNKGVLEWKNAEVDPTDGAASKNIWSTKIWLTAKDQATWSRVQLLLRAGWLEEAQSELHELPAAYRADDRAVRGLLWAASGQYAKASKLVNDAWDENPELRRQPFTRAAFPVEFLPYIKIEAANRKLEPVVVQSLIKQESAYNVKAVSTSNAYGLMQMIPPTAREIAADLRLGKLTLPDDMFQPQRNIVMGTYYLARMINRYQGNIPLGLASYNAGPARIDRWLKARPTLKNVMTTKSSDPDDEIWFDEIPYGETNYYVKAILRNILLYRVLDQGKVEVGNSIWSFSSGTSSTK